MKIRIATLSRRTVKFLGAASLLCSLMLLTTHSKTAFSQLAPQNIQISQESKHQTKSETPEIVGFRIAYVYEYGFGGPAYYERVLMLFDDGTFTRNLSALSSGESLVASRQNSPRKWGEWQIGPENDFTYRYSNQSGWLDHASYSSLPLTEGLRLDSCYTALSTTNAANTHGTFCFADNGYFNYRIGDRNKVGAYAIKENRIGMLYDDGTSEVRFFGIYSDDVLISLNGIVFTRQNSSE